MFAPNVRSVGRGRFLKAGDFSAGAIRRAAELKTCSVTKSNCAEAGCDIKIAVSSADPLPLSESFLNCVAPHFIGPLGLRNGQ